MVIINDDYENAVIKGKGVDGCSVDEVNDPVNSKTPEASQTLGVTDKQDNRTIGLSEDELFAQFLDAEEKAGLLRIYTPDKAKKQARRLFNCALGDMQEYGVEVLSVKNLADIFKSKGNDAMMLFKEYPFAIFSYTVAIALCGDNAIYYCNRAAAYTQTKQYTEAISDCQKAIELDSSYRKAYSRLGSVYFAQGKYNDAIQKGFKKALQLDPDNESMKGYIQAAEQKIMEEHNRESYPQFDLNDYPLASDEDRKIMKMINEYNRRNHAIIGEQKLTEEGQRVGDDQLEMLGDALRSVGQMVGGDSIKIETQDDNNNNNFD